MRVGISRALHRGGGKRRFPRLSRIRPPHRPALCAKGPAAPELVYHQDRLLYPLKRTRPQGDPDPGWQRISWDEALDLTATRLRQLAERHGPESVVFSMVSASTSAIADSQPWIQRLMRAFGSPNLCGSMELCGWGRGFASRYTYGVGMGTPGTHMPDLENAGCILFWGYNPSLARLAHATRRSRRSGAVRTSWSITAGRAREQVRRLAAREPAARALAPGCNT